MLLTPGYNWIGITYPQTIMTAMDIKKHAELFGAIPKMTRLKAEKTIWFNSLSVSRHQVLMRIMDGEFSGHLVSVDSLSLGLTEAPEGTILPAPNPTYLQLE
jgi:hypothetical protein